MTNGQKIAIGAGVILAFGVGYYICRKMKNTAGAGSDAGSGGGGGGGGSLSEAQATTGGRGSEPNHRTIESMPKPAPTGTAAPTTGWTASQRGGGTVVRPTAPVVRLVPTAPTPISRPTTTTR